MVLNTLKYDVTERQEHLCFPDPPNRRSCSSQIDWFVFVWRSLDALMPGRHFLFSLIKKEAKNLAKIITYQPHKLTHARVFWLANAPFQLMLLLNIIIISLKMLSTPSPHQLPLEVPLDIMLLRMHALMDSILFIAIFIQLL